MKGTKGSYCLRDVKSNLPVTFIPDVKKRRKRWSKIYRYPTLHFSTYKLKCSVWESPFTGGAEGKMGKVTTLCRLHHSVGVNVSPSVVVSLLSLSWRTDRGPLMEPSVPDEYMTDNLFSFYLMKHKLEYIKPHVMSSDLIAGSHIGLIKSFLIPFIHFH